MRLPALEAVTLVRRYKRFLADVERASGERLTVHCPNTGAMTGCAEPGSPAWISRSANPRRKYPHTLEIVATRDGKVSVNTARANRLVREAIEAGVLEHLAGYSEIRAEVAIPDGGGRFDLGLTFPELTGYVEVKSATLHVGDGTGAFPDAVSARAAKHVAALARQVRRGQRGILVFCAQHAGIERVRPAHEVDVNYGRALLEAMDDGVEVVALGCRIDGDSIVADRRIEFIRE